MKKSLIIDLNSAHSREAKITDQFETHEARDPTFLSISIMAPIMGGDVNQDGTIGMADLKHAGMVVAEGLENDGVFPASDESGPRNTNSTSVGEIALPMPMGFSYEEGANWADEQSVAADVALGIGSFAAGKLFGGSGVVSSIFGVISAGALLSAARKVGQRQMGVGFEPRKEMFYNGPQFREFSFSWEFSPRSKREADAVRGAVNLIRENMYPDRVSHTLSSIGFEVWRLPSTFVLSFITGDKENEYLPKIKPCVVSSLSYNPTNTGTWKSFDGGSPLSSLLTVAFKEVEVVTQKDIEEGF